MILLTRRCHAALAGILVGFACVSIAGFCLMFLLHQVLLATVGEYRHHLPEALDFRTTDYPPATTTKAPARDDTSETRGYVPHSLQTVNTPQMVLLTFEGFLNASNVGVFPLLLGSARTNPNGCPVTTTLFLAESDSVYHTNYTMARQLYNRGHEIANLGWRYKTNKQWWKEADENAWLAQYGKQRGILLDRAAIPAPKGLRNPSLYTGSNRLFRVASKLELDYDSTVLAKPSSVGPWWPWSLGDDRDRRVCDAVVCPRYRYPGLWEVPINTWSDSNQTWVQPSPRSFKSYDKPKMVATLWRNFDYHYNTNRAPFLVRLPLPTLRRSREFVDAMREFVSGLAQRQDVYIVSVAQMLAWLTQPVDVEQAAAFQPWKRSCANAVQRER